MLTPRPKRLKSRPVPRRFKVAAFFAGAMALAIGMLSPITVHLVGQLPVAEIVIPLLLPFLIVVRRKEMLNPNMRRILILLGAWLAAQIVTDIYRHTEPRDWMRGDANIIFFAMDLLVFVALMGKSERRKIVYLIAFAMSKILITKFHPDPSAQQDKWKFGYAVGLVILVYLISCYFYKRRNYAVMLLILLSFCAVNVVLNCRSTVLFIFISIALTVPIIPGQIGRLQLLPPEGTKARLLYSIVLALCTGMVAFGVVEFATKAGLLGAHQKVKNEKQAQSAGGILLGGRPEILVSSQAIVASPILGHGSWPKDPKYTEMLADVKARYGIHIDIENDEETKAGVIPSHSYVFGAWVAAGVFGAVFWFSMVGPTIRALIKVSLLRNALAPLYAYLLIDLIWNIFFSPFAGNHRILAAFGITVMIDMLETPLPVVAKKAISRFSGVWNEQLRWRPSVRF